MWDVEFYETVNGACPTQEFLNSLNKKDELPYVKNKIDMLQEHGNNLTPPHVKLLRDGIYELRIHIIRKQIRLLYFYFYQEKIIISHGLRKEAKVKDADIEKAKKHKEDYFSRNQRKR